MPTTATMMYGHVETVEHRLEHLDHLRQLQDERGGFTAFITWNFQPDHTDLGADATRWNGAKATGYDHLRTVAVARLFLDNIPSLQASWVTQGPKIAQVSLRYGVNDFGSTMLEENVVSAAGTSHTNRDGLGCDGTADPRRRLCATAAQHPLRVGGFTLSNRRFARGRPFMKPRLGAVPYLNTRPLVFALERDPAPFALSYSVPSRCARELAAGTIDVGVIPAIEYARSPHPYWIVPDIAIGSQGSVLTVRLFCRRPLPQIERIALDTSSRTSVALLSILLRERFALTSAIDRGPTRLGGHAGVCRRGPAHRRSGLPVLGQGRGELGLGPGMDRHDRSAFCVCLLGRPPAGAHARSRSNNCSGPKIRGYAKCRPSPQRTAENAAARPSSTSAT